MLRELVRSADILIENFRPGTMERWGLGYEALVEISPRLIMVRVFGFGQSARSSMPSREADSPLAERIVTTSPEVTVATGLRPRVNRRGRFS